jgi:hypothetical protein
MSKLLFAFLNVSGSVIGISLAIGLVLLVGGLLLTLLPSSEDRPRRTRRRRQNPEPPLFLPGHRIRGEEAKRSRQRLEVRRLVVLDAAAHPPQMPAISAPPPVPARNEIEGQQLAVLPASVPEQSGPVSKLPPYAWSEEMALAETVYSLPSTEGSGAAETVQENDISTALQEPGEALPEMRQSDQSEQFQETNPELESVSGTMPAPQPQIATGGVEDTTTLQSDQAREDEALPTMALAPESHVSSHVSSMESVPDAVATAASPIPAAQDEEADVITAELPVPPPIRKAKLSTLTQAPPAAPGYVLKDASSGSGEPEEAPAGAVRRARLKGFPASTGESPADLPPLNPPEELLAQLGLASPVSPASHERLTESSEPVVGGTASGVETASGGLRIVCFGTVDILVAGQPLSPLDSRFRSSREFELMAFLAHAAAPRRQAFVDRATIIDALVPEELGDNEDEEHPDDGDEPPETRRSPISNWKYRLCRRLRRQGIPDHAWLETRADGALRLRSDVQIDVAEFLQVASNLRKAHDQIRRPGAKQIPRESIQEWLGQFQTLYRDRGAFAEQFQLREWTQEPRRRYRSVYWHGIFYAARLLAALGERQPAIHLAEELFEADEVDTEEVFETLLTWLGEEGNRTDLLRWLNTYRDWYADVYRGKSLDKARPDLIELVNKQHA